MLTTDGEVKVLDFGTARATFGTREAQTQALAFGSQAYMAPERMLQEEDTFYGDVFSLAVTFYEVLTTRRFGKIPLRPEKYDRDIKKEIKSCPITPPTKTRLLYKKSSNSCRICWHGNQQNDPI